MSELKTMTWHVSYGYICRNLRFMPVELEMVKAKHCRGSL